MKQKKVSLDIGHLKPVMKSLRTIDDIPISRGTVVSAKADGELTLVNFGPEGCYMVNGWRKLRQDFPALNELQSALQRKGLNDAQLLCEFYATREDGTPAKLPEFIHIAKGKDTDHTRLRLGVWDLLRANGKEVGDYGWKMDEVSEWLRGCRYCHVLPYIKPTKRSEIRAFWKEHVEGGYEGVVARLNSDIYKIKPVRDVDAVIIAINKRELFKERKVTSFKVALMDEDGSFVVLSDVASGIDHELRRALWKLMETKVNEDDESVYIRPFIVCTVEYQETFPRDTPKLTFDGKKYREAGMVEFYSLRHPRLKRFRSDKTVNPTDLRLSQILEGTNTFIHIKQTYHCERGCYSSL